MVSTTESRPNHYEILGLEPTASSAEIARAFSSRTGVFQPRAFGHIAETSIAFATLRDPIKRRAYDASLGLNKEPAPSPSLMMWGGKSQFIGSSLGGPFARDFNDRSPALPPRANPPARPESDPEPRTGSVIAASLRAPSQPEARHETRPAPPEQSQPPSSPPADVASTFDPKISRDDFRGRAEALRLGAVEDHPVEWKRAAIAAGALVGAVALIGAWLGVEAGNDAEQLQPEPAVTVALAPPPTRPAVAGSAPVPARGPEEAREGSRRFAATRVPNPRTVSAPRSAAPDGQAEIARSEAGQAADPVEQATTEASPAVPVAASMPLPNAVVARTIERIGYACGQVASTTASASPGVFRVNCTSGNSYQATPIRGRYRFRRLGGH